MEKMALSKTEMLFKASKNKALRKKLMETGMVRSPETMVRGAHKGNSNIFKELKRLEPNLKIKKGPDPQYNPMSKEVTFNHKTKGAQKAEIIRHELDEARESIKGRATGSHATYVSQKLTPKDKYKIRDSEKRFDSNLSKMDDKQNDLYNRITSTRKVLKKRELDRDSTMKRVRKAADDGSYRDREPARMSLYDVEKNVNLHNERAAKDYTSNLAQHKKDELINRSIRDMTSNKMDQKRMLSNHKYSKNRSKTLDKMERESYYVGLNKKEKGDFYSGDKGPSDFVMHGPLIRGKDKAIAQAAAAKRVREGAGKIVTKKPEKPIPRTINDVKMVSDTSLNKDVADTMKVHGRVKNTSTRLENMKRKYEKGERDLDKYTRVAGKNIDKRKSNREIASGHGNLGVLTRESERARKSLYPVPAHSMRANSPEARNFQFHTGKRYGVDKVSPRDIKPEKNFTVQYDNLKEFNKSNADAYRYQMGANWKGSHIPTYNVGDKVI